MATLDAKISHAILTVLNDSNIHDVLPIAVESKVIRLRVTLILNSCSLKDFFFNVRCKIHQKNLLILYP